MSMNLVYDYMDEHKNYITSDRFEFQTPTSLTYKVLNAEDKEEQIRIIEEYLLTLKLDFDDLKFIMMRIELKLSNPRIKLGMI